MSYTFNASLFLGTSQTGLTLNAQLFDDNGANVGSVITTGFIEIGNGMYMWKATVPDNFSGGSKIFSSSSPSSILAFISINKQEIEDINLLGSSVSEILSKVDSLQVDISSIKNVVDSTKEITIQTPQIIGNAESVSVVPSTQQSGIQIKTGVR
jgi:hypothetical protein